MVRKRNHNKAINREKNSNQKKPKVDVMGPFSRLLANTEITRAKEQAQKVEKNIIKDCKNYNVNYMPPTLDENSLESTERQKQLQEKISNKRKAKQSKQSQTRKKKFSKLLITSDKKPVGNHKQPTSSLDSNIIEPLHGNPQVFEMIKRFHQGEQEHVIQTCKSCHESRPLFHETESSPRFAGDHKPYDVKKWKIFKDGRCFNCHEEFRKNKKKLAALKFSGYLSHSEDCYKENESYFHNYQHLLPEKMLIIFPFFS